MEITQRLRNAITSDITATDAALDPATTYVGLYVSGPDPSPPDTVADFVLPDATDMPAQKVTSWGAIHYLEDGRTAVDAPAKTFRLPSSAHAFVAGGFYIADALTGGNVLAWEPLGTGLPMPDEHYTITVIPRIAPPLGPDYASNVAFDG